MSGVISTSMSYRDQNKPPRSQSNKKEGLLEEAPLEKRRRIAVGSNMVAPATAAASRRWRQVLSSVNATGANLEKKPSVSASVASSDCRNGEIEFNGREDVERLLNEKVKKGKNNYDFKGKYENLSEYDRKLKLCIRWYMDLENENMLEREKMQTLLESESKRHSDIAAHMKEKEEGLNMILDQLKGQIASLEGNLRKEESDKLAFKRSYEKEMEERSALEKSREALSEELERVNLEAKRGNEQLKLLQENNKRLQEYNSSLQQYNSNLQSDAQKNGEALSKSQKDKNAMMESLTSSRDHNNILKNQLDASRTYLQDAIKQKEESKNEVSCLRTELQQVRDERDNLLVQLQNLTAQVVSYKEISGKSVKDLDDVCTKAKLFEETCSSQRLQIQSLQHQLAVAVEKLKLADLTTNETLVEYEGQKQLVIDLQNRVAEKDHQILEGENLRKKLHNTILELKGNIRVFCRVRPLLSESESNGADDAVVSYPASVEFLGRGIDLLHHEQKHSFTFDKVFSHEASQEDVFFEISQLVQSALDGYKVCIFAYGQTGSGKTYTMMGNPEADQQKGMIPRSLEQIFQTSQSLQCQGWKYTMQASMLEIYNETIRDLLAPSRSGGSDLNALSKHYNIKHDSNGNTQVSDLTVVDVCSIKEISFLLQHAARSRSVGRTQMNEQSSRSHCVFTLRISGVNESTEQQVQGVLNLIDLAGSERLAKSCSTGERLKETQSINKSLSALADVIFAIAKKDDHVPFRNSKLTYLLQPCLGGDSKTLMFVNISPEESSSQESVSSLRFAARVNSCEIGIPRRQTNQVRATAAVADPRLSYG